MRGRTSVASESSAASAGTGRLEVDQVSKSYKRAPYANRDISFRVSDGEVFGLLGPNGAGKTTLVKQILGLLAPDSGRIHVAGHDITASPHLATQLCSFQPQTSVPIQSIPMRTAIALAGEFRGLTRRDAASRADDLVERLDIARWAKIAGDALSGGVARLAGFAMALVATRPLIVLDEPTNDVDPQRRRLLWSEVRRVADDDGSSVVLVTHNVLEAEKCVDRLAILHGGCVADVGTVASLVGTTGTLMLEVAVAGDNSPEWPPAVQRPRRIGSARFAAELQQADVSEVVRWCSAHVANGTLENFRLNPRSLEERYLEIVADRADS